MHMVQNVGNFGLLLNIAIPETPLAVRRTQQIQWRRKNYNLCFEIYVESYPQQFRRRVREMAASGAIAEQAGATPSAVADSTSMAGSALLHPA